MIEMQCIEPAKLKLIIRREPPPKNWWQRLKWHVVPNIDVANPTRLVLRGEQAQWLLNSMQRHDIAITPANIALVCSVRFISLVTFANSDSLGATFLKDQLEMSCICERSRAQAQELAEMANAKL